MFKATLVIPTYNEAQNLPVLLEEIFSVIDKNHIDLEVIIIDDNSPDGTGVIAEKFKDKYQLIVIHRSEKLGLGSAVAEGFKKSNRDFIGVMDADLSHDPKILPTLITSLQTCDITIGSRFEPQSKVEQWTWWRKLLSKVGVALASNITKVKDPLSGYFFIKRKVIENISLTTRGYKILFEILVMGKYETIKEVPFIFRVRKFSTSKLDYQEYFLFLKQLSKYYFYIVFKNFKKYFYFYIFSFLFFCLIIYINFNQSIWLDEGLSKEFSEHNIKWIINLTATSDLHPPVYYILIHSISKITDSRIEVYRLLSSVFYFFTAYILFYYLLSKNFFEKKFSIFSAIFFLTSPFAVYYASEIRSYMLVILIGLFRFILFDRICEQISRNRKYLFGYTASSIFAIYLFYPFLFSLAAEFLYIIFFKRKYFKIFFIPWIIIFISYIPWVYLVILKRITETPGHFLTVPWWQIPIVLFIGFSGGRLAITDINHLHQYWPTVLVSLVYLINLSGFYWWKKNKQMIGFLGRILWMLTITILFCLAVSYFRFSIFDPRYYAQIFPLFIMLIICVNYYIFIEKPQLWKWITGCLITINILFLILYTFNPWYAREPWKKVVTELESELKENDAIVFIGFNQPPPTYTAYQKKSIEIVSTYKDGLKDIADFSSIENHLQKSLQDNDRIWYSQFLEWQKDPNHKIRKMIEKKYIYKKTIGFFKVQFDLYERKK